MNSCKRDEGDRSLWQRLLITLSLSPSFCLFLSKRVVVVVTKSDFDVSNVFFFQLSMRYTKKSGGFFLDGWDASLSLFFILDFFCVCVILKP